MHGKSHTPTHVQTHARVHTQIALAFRAILASSMYMSRMTKRLFREKSREIRDDVFSWHPWLPNPPSFKGSNLNY